MADFQRRYLLEKFEYIQGRRLPDECRTLLFTFEHPVAVLKTYDILPNNASAPLVAPHIAAWFEKHCPDDVQLIPVEIAARDGVSSDYKLVNITNAVPTIDKERSVPAHRLQDGVVLRYRPMYLLPRSLGDRHIVRDADLHSFIVVSGELKRTFEDQRWKGVEFVSPESS